MDKITNFLVLAVFLTVVQNGFSQQYFTKSYTIENGLSTRIVNDVCQDSAGTMWFATQGGISSYDGFRFTNYDAANELPRQHYHNLICDETGTIWAIPGRVCDTVVSFKDNVWKKINPMSTVTETAVNNCAVMQMEAKPVICLGTAAGLYIWQNDRWIHVDISHDPGENRILSLTSNNHKFYASNKAGIYVVDHTGNGWSVSEFLKSPVKPFLGMKFERPGAPDEKLWLLSADRLSYLQQGKMTLHAEGFTLPQPSSISECAYIGLDTSGNVFLGNSRSKYFVSGIHGTVSPLMVDNGFSSNGATSVFIDREQNVWFTDTRGIDKIGNLMLLNYYEIHGLLENEVSAAVELDDGRLVFGHNNGLTVFDHGKFKRIPFYVNIQNLSRVLEIMQDDRGNIWFAASYLGFGKLLANGTIRWYPVGPGEMASAIYQDVNGRMWMGTINKLYYLQNDQLFAFNYNDKFKPSFRNFFTGKNGELILTGLYGLYRIAGDELQQYPVGNEVNTKSFYTYYRSRSGDEFVGSMSGLCMIEQGTIRKFNKGGITINSPVYFILQDDDGNFWIGSNNGIFIWDGKSKLESFTIQSGLAGRETNRAAAVVDSHKNIWIGTEKGVTCFLKDFLKKTVPAPVLRPINIVDNKGISHSFDQQCTIGFNDNTLYFHFRGISFVNEDLITYRYKLDGFDRDWQFVSQENLDKVKYAGMQPGTYRLMVQARNGSGEWSKLVSSGPIQIRMPVFRTWWFNVILFIFISAIIFGVIKIFHQRKYNLQLENEIAERKRSEQKTVMTLQALHESELKYRELIEFAVDGILMGSKDGIITGANTYMQTLTGRTEENLIGVHVEQLFNQDHLQDVPLRFDLLEKGEMIVRRRNILRPDGTLVPVEMHTKMMPDGSYQSIYHDITSRKQAEQKLRESQSLYKLITDKMTDVVWLMDLKGNSTFVSPSIEQFTGFTVEEYMSQSFDDRFTAGSAAIAMKLFWSEIARLKSHPEKLHGFSHTQQMEYVCKNGSAKWGELLISPYFGEDGEWLGIHGVTRDITARKKLEDAFRASEDKFVKAFQNSPDPFVITRLSDGTYIDVNESYLRYTGYDREEMLGKNVNDVSIWLNADDRLRYVSQLMREGRVSNQEINYRTKSGETRCALASAELIKINGEQCILAIVHDITDRKHAEEALKEKADELERFNSLMVGRELKMIELKKEINALLVLANKVEKYKVHDK